MSILSLGFAGFVGLVAVAYYLLPRRGQNLLLLAASYLFYVTWSWQFLASLLALTAFNFVLARRLEPAQSPRPIALRVGVGVNVLVLVFFKYVDFFVPEILVLLSRLGVPVHVDTLNVLLPVGLSFYSLQAISYLVDVYRGQLSAASDWAEFALYMAYFPKLTAGPIERARSFLPKLAGRRTLNSEVLAKGFTLIMIGLVRKIVIANPLLGAIPNRVFEDPAAFSGGALAAWLLAYACGIYCDFAGYTDVARGVSALYGIQLSRNFDQPFFSRNLGEFWNRWHISLSLSTQNRNVRFSAR